MDRQTIEQFLSTLVEFDTSINPARDQFPSEDCAKFIRSHAKNHGWEDITPVTKYKETDQPLYAALLVKRGENPGKTVLFLGHIDVVPVTEEELKEWKYDPFTATIEDDLLYGRGAGDMKAGVSAFFGAFDEKSITKGTVIIALSGDEEIGGMDTMPKIVETLQEQDLLPDYVINAEASATPVIVTKRRGGTQIKYTFDLDYDRAPGQSISKKFYSSLGDGGEGLHSMSFLLGASSHAMITAGVYTMDKPISHVQSSSVKTNSVPREVVLAYVEEDNTVKQGIMYSKGITGVMHALASIGSLHYPIVPSKFGPSICPNLIDIDRDTDKGHITFDIRSMLRDSEAHQEIAKLIQDHFKSYGVETEYEMQLVIDPVNVDPDVELAVQTERLSNKHGFMIMSRGEKLGGASDTRFFTSLGIPGIELGPIAHNAHGINENVELDGIMKLIEIYRELFDTLQI